MKNEEKKVSVISVNFNQKRVTIEMINSLLKVNYKNIEIIIVDNASKEPIDELKILFSNIKLVKSDKNLGFAGGNNLGMRYATGEFILFLNNDVEVEVNFLEPLINTLNSDANIAAVSPKILYYSHPTIIQYAGGERMNRFTLKNKHRGTGQKDLGQYNNTTETNYAHGACMMIKNKDVAEIGLMDEQFFLYYEEQDWCERILNKNRKIVYVHNSIIYHKESISTGKNSPLKTYYLTRNRLLFARKNFPIYSLIISLGYFCVFTIPKNTVSNLFKKEHQKAFWKAIWWNINLKKQVI